jgi:hypothetical protein
VRAILSVSSVILSYRSRSDVPGFGSFVAVVGVLVVELLEILFELVKLFLVGELRSVVPWDGAIVIVQIVVW